MAAVVKKELKLLRSTLPATIAIDERIAPVPPICADESKMGQVLMNLAPMRRKRSATGRAPSPSRSRRLTPYPSEREKRQFIFR
jgi:hypothetical protein